MLSFLSAHALKPINHWHEKPLKRESNHLKFPIIDELMVIFMQFFGFSS